MKINSTRMTPLAPLQRVMLRDSLAEENAGHHLEQIEIVFSPGKWCLHIAAAWQETVTRTEALRIAFLIDDRQSLGFERMEPRTILHLEEPLPVSWEAWLDTDRQRPLLVPHEVPWRAVYWPHASRFIWTFHHALLDGRSIAAVLGAFLSRVAGCAADHLALSKWHPPTASTLELAEKMFQKEFALHQPEESGLSPNPRDNERALRFLGDDFGKRLKSMASGMEVTTATVLIWAWGQALMETSGTDAVIVEQVRSGAPQKGTAGFTMHTLPLIIHRADPEEVVKHLQKFRTHLIGLRSIEGVVPADFSPGVFPDVDHAGSSLIMVEHATLPHLLGGEMIESLALHECKGETLMATAHILPDLRLEVEGPEKQKHLDRWIGVLERMERLHGKHPEFIPTCGTVGRNS